MRMIQIQDNISEQKNLKDKLESEQEKLHVEYNKVSNTIFEFSLHVCISVSANTCRQDTHTTAQAFILQFRLHFETTSP